METKPGSGTSEFKLTVIILGIGVALDVAGIVMGSLTDAGLKWPWLAPALIICGTLMALVKALGYTRSRTLVKLAELQPGVTEVAKAAIPLVEQIRQLVKEEMAAARPTPPVPVPVRPPPA